MYPIRKGIRYASKICVFHASNGILYMLGLFECFDFVNLKCFEIRFALTYIQNSGHVSKIISTLLLYKKIEIKDNYFFKKVMFQILGVEWGGVALNN